MLSILPRLVLLALTALLLSAPASQAATQIVRVETPTPGQKDLLQSLGLDLTESAGPEYVDVVIHGAKDVAVLDRARLRHTTQIADLEALTRANLSKDRAFARSTRVSDLPSGRTDYRTLAGLNDELRKLAADNPDLVKLIELPEKTTQGKPVLGVEITKDVNAEDGKPVFLNMGAHHAREWPSVEHAMEWANEMIKGERDGDARVQRLNRSIRTIVVPVVNPDGYQISRDLGPIDNPDGGIVEAGAYKRKNCNTDNSNPAGTTAPGTCETMPALGTDPNRNYGGLWGGPGASAVPAEADYRGPAPFSEPETRNVRFLASTRQVTTLITNHTFSNLVLRPPGVAAQGPSIDENRGYKALGDAMAAQNGYASQLSFQLYDTTGTTEDYTYYATGGFGFTFEIGLDEFHPPYQDVIAEYEGTADAAKAIGGKGNREAYFVAAESTADAARHSTLEGRALPGATLRLKKSFKTKTSPVLNADGSTGAVRELDDTLETTMTVPASGAFEWGINPSTRPAVAAKEGREPKGPPSETIELAEQPILPGGTVTLPYTYAPEPGSDDEVMTVEVTNAVPQDYDINVFRKNADGSRTEVGSSANFVESREAAAVRKPVPGEYELDVTSFAASGIEYSARVTFQGPTPPTAGQVEAWTLTCEKDGATIGTEQVVIDRSERKTVNPCRVAGSSTATGAGTTGKAGTNPAGTPATPGGAGSAGAGGAVACTAGAQGLSSASVASASRGGLGVRFARGKAARVDVDVFQVSAGRKVIAERRVARFAGRTSSFTWNGRVKSGRRAPSGTYFVRYRAGYADGAVRRTDARRFVVRRSGGRFSSRPAFFRRESCEGLRSFKLERPVFGGTGRRALGISYRTAAAGRVAVTVLRGTTVVKRFASTASVANSTTRLRLPAARLSRGDYTVRLVYTAGGATVRATLTAGKL